MKDSMIEELKSEPRLAQGNLQIIACAGSGKTDFVSTRIACIIAEGLAKPENIVTFTERKEVNSRLPPVKQASFKPLKVL